MATAPKPVQAQQAHTQCSGGRIKGVSGERVTAPAHGLKAVTGAALATTAAVHDDHAVAAPGVVTEAAGVPAATTGYVRLSNRRPYEPARSRFAGLGHRPTPPRPRSAARPEHQPGRAWRRLCTGPRCSVPRSRGGIAVLFPGGDGGIYHHLPQHQGALANEEEGSQRAVGLQERLGVRDPADGKLGLGLRPRDRLYRSCQDLEGGGPGL